MKPLRYSMKLTNKLKKNRIKLIKKESLKFK